MDPIIGASAALLTLAGVMWLVHRIRHPRRSQIRERAENERLGVRISEEIEARRRRA